MNRTRGLPARAPIREQSWTVITRLELVFALLAAAFLDSRYVPASCLVSNEKKTIHEITRTSNSASFVDRFFI
jgi:hypothetical protein